MCAVQHRRWILPGIHWSRTCHLLGRDLTSKHLAVTAELPTSQTNVLTPNHIHPHSSSAEREEFHSNTLWEFIKYRSDWVTPHYSSVELKPGSPLRAQLLVSVGCGCQPVLWALRATAPQFFYRRLFGSVRQETRETKEAFVTFSHQLIGNRTHVPSRQQGTESWWNRGMREVTFLF